MKNKGGLYEINEIELYVPDAIAGIQTLIVATDKNEIVGFMSIENHILEMLFLDPKSRGKGLGKKFIKMALDKFDVKFLDVNENNPQAVGFYEHMGFEAFERSDLDDQGKPYPILHMKHVE